MFRFTATFASTMESYPLQIYCSGLLFAPEDSIIKKRFWSSCRPKWIDVVRGPVEKDWHYLLRNFEGHDDYVYAMAFSPDGSMLATGSVDHVIKLWSPSSGALLASLDGHLASIRQIQFSHDCSVIASTDTDGTIITWSTTTATPIKRIAWPLPNAQPICAISFFPTRNHLVASRGDGKIEVLDVLTGACLSTWDIQEKATVVSLRVSHNGLFMISMSLQQVGLYCAESGILLQALWQVQLKYGIMGQFSKVQFSDDDRYIAWNIETTVYWFDRHKSQTIQPIRTPRVGDNGPQPLTQFDFLPTSTCLGILREYSTDLEIFDLDTGTMLKRIALAPEICCFIISPNTSDLVCGAVGRHVALWDLGFVSSVESGTQAHIPLLIELVPCSTELLVLANSSNVHIVDIHNHTQALHISISSEGARGLRREFHSSSRIALGIYKSPADHELHYFFNHSKRKQLLKSFSDVLRFSPSGDRLLAGLQDGSLIMFDTSADSFEFLWKLFAHDYGIHDLCFLAGEQCFLSVTRERTAKLWKSDSKTLLKKIKLPKIVSGDGPHCVAVSPDGFTITIAKGWFAIVYEWPLFLPKVSFRSAYYISKLSYDDSGEFLRTEMNIWKVDPTQASSAKASHDASKYLFKRESWICQDGRKLLWLAPSYSKVSAIRGNAIALGHQAKSNIMVINVDWFSQQGSVPGQGWWETTEVAYKVFSQSNNDDDDEDDDDDDDDDDEGDDDDNDDDENKDNNSHLTLKRKRASTLTNHAQEDFNAGLQMDIGLSNR